MLTYASNGSYGPTHGTPLYFAPQKLTVDRMEELWIESGENWIFYAEAIQKELGAV